MHAEALLNNGKSRQNGYVFLTGGIIGLDQANSRALIYFRMLMSITQQKFVSISNFELHISFLLGCIFS